MEATKKGGGVLCFCFADGDVLFLLQAMGTGRVSKWQCRRDALTTWPQAVASAGIWLTWCVLTDHSPIAYEALVV
jgi:hypothetical protein